MAFVHRYILDVKIRPTLGCADNSSKPLPGLDDGRAWPKLPVAEQPKLPGAKQIDIEQHIADGREGETVSRFITRLGCATCRRMSDTIKLRNAKPRLEIILLGP
jgi:hypothetical protein